MRIRRFLAAFILAFLWTFLFVLSAGAADDPIIENANVTTSLQQWEIVTSFVLPLVLSFIIQSQWTQRVQAFAAFFASLVVTLVQCYLRGELDNWTDPTMSFLTVLALTTTFYKGWWKPSGISPTIEERTNIGARPIGAVGGGG